MRNTSLISLGVAWEGNVEFLTTVHTFASGSSGNALLLSWTGGRLLVDVSDFTPTRFDGEGRAIGGAFRSAPVQEGKQWFVRLEFHDFPPDRDGMYVIRNKAFYCSPDGFPGQPAPLECVPEWAGLAPETVIQGLQGPLFACFKPPEANAEEPGSRLGASVYAGAAAELIRQADEQWRMIRWEYESGKRRIYVDGVDAGQFNDEIFVVGPFSKDGNFFDVFSPEFRDAPLYGGFQRILQRIEFQVGLAYVCLTTGVKYVKPVTAILVTGIEPVLNPILVAIVVGETLSPLSLLGGVIVFVSVMVYNILSARGERPSPQPQGAAKPA